VEFRVWAPQAQTVAVRLEGETHALAAEQGGVQSFPGDRGWGYGIYTFAPHPAYGGPEGLGWLIDAADREGLG
jgi:maltooligosyltrehalose trehalohydrolase